MKAKSVRAGMRAVLPLALAAGLPFGAALAADLTHYDSTKPSFWKNPPKD